MVRFGCEARLLWMEWWSQSPHMGVTPPPPISLRNCRICPWPTSMAVVTQWVWESCGLAWRKHMLHKALQSRWNWDIWQNLSFFFNNQMWLVWQCIQLMVGVSTRLSWAWFKSDVNVMKLKFKACKFDSVCNLMMAAQPSFKRRGCWPALK